MKEQQISQWCPARKLQVVLDCEVSDLPNTTIQKAVPVVCWELRKNGCVHNEKSWCLLGKPIEGNYRMEVKE